MTLPADITDFAAMRCHAQDLAAAATVAMRPVVLEDFEETDHA